MFDRGIGAVVKVENGTKYTIENDGIVNINTTSGGKYEEARVVGMGDGCYSIRVVLEKDGISEIPIKNIASIEDAQKLPYKCVMIE